MKGIYLMNGEEQEWRDTDHSRDKEKLIETMIKDFKSQIEDLIELDIGIEKAIFSLSEKTNKWIVDTRFSRDPRMRSNGGDYDCAARYFGSFRWTWREDWCSFDWDIMEYGGTLEAYRVPSKEIPNLLRQALAKVKAQYER
jgi:hypothetical protein